LVDESQQKGGKKAKKKSQILSGKKVTVVNIQTSLSLNQTTQ
jgi:hypothetical protein